MKVWIVEHWMYNEGEVVGVFSDEQKANNYVQAQRNTVSYEIFEAEVDYLCK